MPGTNRSGPRSAPTALKILKGTEKSRINQDEPELPIAEPQMPEYLDERAQQEWNHHLAGLLEAGVLSERDGQVFAEFCQAVSNIIRYTDKCREPDGEVNEKGQRTRWTLLLREANEARRRCEIELGLTPSARTRVKAIKKKTLNPFSTL